jgi:hypothetical protein
MKKYFIPNRYDISTEINGKVYNGYYTEEKGMITVNYEDFSKSTQQSLSKNDVLAKMILRQLVRNHRND